MAREGTKIHLIQVFVAGVGHTICGRFVGNDIVTAFHHKVTCKCCLRSIGKKYRRGP